MHLPSRLRDLGERHTLPQRVRIELSGRRQFLCILSFAERLWLKENYFKILRNHAKNTFSSFGYATLPNMNFILSNC